MPPDKPAERGPSTVTTNPDPTYNVMELVEASNRRQDDMREAIDRFSSQRIDHMKEMAALRSENTKEIMALRSDYQEKLADAEAKRIDANREVDANAVAVANERQVASAQVLANQVAQSADALRTLVATTATTAAESQRQQWEQFNNRLALVEKAQYEGKGAQAISDPAMMQALAEIKSLRESRAQVGGKSEGINSTWAVIIAAIAALAALYAIWPHK